MLTSIPRTTAIELEQQSQKRQAEENTWCRQQDLLLKGSLEVPIHTQGVG